MEEFSPEQRIAIEVMRVAGTKDPEAVARADRVSASLVGGALEPVLRRMCDAASAALQAFMDLFPVTCPLCLMKAWRRTSLRCDFCGVTGEELRHAGLSA